MTKIDEAPKHKRYLYRYRGSETIQVGVQTQAGMDHAIWMAGTKWDKCSSAEAAFEATFRHTSAFIRWVDTEWRAE